MIDRIETEEDYWIALKRFLEICSAQENSDEYKELIVLMFLLEKYEKENCAFN